jgi:hypothetical protein
VNGERIPKKVLNIKVKGKYPRGRSRWEQQDRKDVTQMEDRLWEEIEAEVWGDRDLVVRQPS